MKSTCLDWVREDATPSTLCNIVRLFEDSPTAPLGIHAFLRAAGTVLNLDMFSAVGRWFSPTESFTVFRFVSPTPG